ncbi:hypothetical protein QVD17_34822 [Tagetes erecta]|uniref:MADS-box domain-containing protein n=1 Tax=Tagetes erecta TaxID=13708 RepID=A0AAD8JY94_TARER|nr:hypothetical protein QVD17_34822 [Tagetes erecta]
MPRLPRGGRRKIELKKIENQRERAVTLSKRHEGLFKKAGELATLCGAQMAIILFTISGKPLSFGSPNVSNVVKKFLDANHGDQEPDVIESSISAFRKAKIEELNREFDVFNEKSATDKKYGETLEENLKVLLGGKTYEDYKSGIGLDMLMKIRYKLQELKRDLHHGCDEETTSSLLEDEHEADLSKLEGPRDYLKL